MSLLSAAYRAFELPWVRSRLDRLLDRATTAAAAFVRGPFISCPPQLTLGVAAIGASRGDFPARSQLFLLFPPALFPQHAFARSVRRARGELTARRSLSRSALLTSSLFRPQLPSKPTWANYLDEVRHVAKTRRAPPNWDSQFTSPVLKSLFDEMKAAGRREVLQRLGGSERELVRSISSLSLRSALALTLAFLAAGPQRRLSSAAGEREGRTSRRRRGELALVTVERLVQVPSRADPSPSRPQTSSRSPRSTRPTSRAEKRAALRRRSVLFTHDDSSSAAPSYAEPPRAPSPPTAPQHGYALPPRMMGGQYATSFEDVVRAERERLQGSAQAGLHDLGGLAHALDDQEEVRSGPAAAYRPRAREGELRRQMMIRRVGGDE